MGTHRSQRATLAPILYAALAAIYGALAVMGFRSEGMTANAVIYGASVLGWLWLCWAFRAERTVVSEDGVDIRRRFPWRRLRWDDIEGVEPPSHWGFEDVRVRTTSGESVKLDVPLRLAPLRQTIKVRMRAAAPCIDLPRLLPRVAIPHGGLGQGRVLEQLLSPCLDQRGRLGTR